MSNITEKTNLTLKQDWISPIHYYNAEDFAPVRFWADRLNISVEDFIYNYEHNKFINWFEETPE